MEDHGRHLLDAPGSPLARRIQRPDQIAEVFIAAIRQGRLDSSLDAIVEAVTEREKVRREKLLAKVQELYGPEAEIIVKPPPVYRQPNTMLCGAEEGGIPTCGPASDCPHGGNPNA